MRKSALSLAILSLAWGAAVETQAQGTGRGAMLEEVVVTATRREEALQTIPTSISALTAADMENRGITEFRQISDAIAGVSLSRPSSAISAGTYIRGVGTAGTSPADQSVGILVDGVYQLRQGAAFSELMDIERVEILRGPQGTLFGRNTTAGVIRIFTADPDPAEFTGKVQGVVGNLDAQEVRGSVNIPIIKDKLAARLSGYNAERDGYTENLFLNEDTRNEDRQGWRGKLLWDVTDTFQLKAGYEDSEQESRMDQALVEYPDNLLAANPILLEYPVEVGKYQQNESTVSDDVERITANLKWDFWHHTLSTISAWDDMELYLLDDRDRTVLTSEATTFFALTNLGETESETHEVQLTSNWEGPANYVLGYYFQNEQLTSNTTLYSAGGPLVRPPTERDVDSEAMFGTLFYDFNEQWRVSAGARYTDDQKQGTNSQFSGDKKYDEWTWSFKLMNQLDADKMVYLAYDKGFKSGGINREFGRCGALPGARCVQPDEATWDPETSYNYELGMKTQWLDNTLRVNAAIYYQTYDDFQVTQNIQELSNVLVRNAAEVEAMGIEADFLALLNENLTLDGSIAYNKTEYDEFENATCTPGQPGCVDGVQDLSGKQLDHAPELSFNIGSEYRAVLPAMDNTEWFARLDLVYKDDQNLFYEQPAEAEEGSYYLLNTRAGLETDSWRLTLWANNLTDEDYLVEASVDLGGVFKIPGLERTYGLTADYFF